MRQVLCGVVVGFSLLLLGPAPAYSGLIDYVFSGTASGSVGTQGFQNQGFLITLWADTDDITGGPTVFNVLATMAEIEIGGFAPAAILETVGAFSNNSNATLGFQNPDHDFLDIDNPTPPYDLSGNFGPVFDATPFVVNLNNLSTDQGLITFTSARDVTFEAIEKGSAVPEPSTFVLWSLGAVTFVGLGWRRREQMAKSTRAT